MQNLQPQPATLEIPSKFPPSLLPDVNRGAEAQVSSINSLLKSPQISTPDVAGGICFVEGLPLGIASAFRMALLFNAGLACVGLLAYESWSMITR